MLSRGKQVWLGRTLLAVYLLLVCFGHALHALPGHQHGGTSCGCPDSHPSANPKSCSLDCSSSQSCDQAAHQHVALSCPFGHTNGPAPTNSCSEGSCSEEKCRSSKGEQPSFDPNWQNAGCDGSCAICELLAVPQFAQSAVEIDLAFRVLYPATLTHYNFCPSELASAFSARGPPSIIA